MTIAPPSPGIIEHRTLSLHGRPVSYRIASGPRDDAEVIMLVHGMAGSSSMWTEVMPMLAEHHTVIAPDLLGHGASAKFRGDYSLGNQASLLRDLLVVLGHRRCTMVGQSLGGGVVMQTAYQYPERCERMVLVDSGGLGRDVSAILRLLALPGSELVLAGATAAPVRAVLEGLRAALGVFNLSLGPEEAQMHAAFESLADRKTRRAFLATLRSVVDYGGQRVSATDRLYLASDLPVMVIWGDRDPIIPIDHAFQIRDIIDNARLEVFEGAGHFPHNSAPRRFAEVLLDFISSSEPSRTTTEDYLSRVATATD